MNKYCKLGFVVLVMLVSAISMTGANKENTDKSKWKSAEALLLEDDFDKAVVIYQELFDRNQQNFSLAYKIGYCYVSGEFIQDIPVAIDFLKLACENVDLKYKNTFNFKDAPASSWFYLGVAYRLNKDYDKAVEALEMYRSLLSKKERKSVSGQFLDREIQSCKDAKESFDTERIKVEKIFVSNLEDPNIKCPILCYTGNRLIFTNGKFNMFPPDINWDVNYSEGPFDGVYMANRAKDGSFNSPKCITKDFMISRPFIPVTATADGSELYLIVDNNDNGDIYMSKYENDTYQPAQKVKKLNTRKWESHASITADGQRIYFTSMRKGGYGGLDLYYSDRDSEGKWQKPINMGSSINTPFHEEMPYVIRNGHAIYFSSEGHKNVGGFDVFFSNYNDDAKTWETPQNLGYPFSTAGNDMGYVVENTPVFAFCPVNDNKRRGNIGDCDCISLFTEETPMLASLSGIVELDPESKEILLQTRVKLIDKTTGEQIADLALGEDGKYKFENVESGSYDIVAYLMDKDLMTMHVDVPQNESWDITGINMIIPTTELIASNNDGMTSNDTILTPENTEVILRNVLFAFDKYDVTPDNFSNLDSLANYLLSNKDAVIKVTGHTDHYGTEPYNINLSKNRASSVSNYLRNKGVKETQIMIDYKGEAENITIAVDDDSVRRLNRRVIISVEKQGKTTLVVKPIEVPVAYRLK